MPHPETVGVRLHADTQKLRQRALLSVQLFGDPTGLKSGRLARLTTNRRHSCSLMRNGRPDYLTTLFPKVHYTKMHRGHVFVNCVLQIANI